MFKKELYVTNNLDKYNRLKNLLVNQGIHYKSKVVAQDGANSSIFAMMFGSSRRARGSYGVNMSLTKMYYIYVDKKDFEVAQLIKNQL